MNLKKNIAMLMCISLVGSCYLPIDVSSSNTVFAAEVNTLISEDISDVYVPTGTTYTWKITPQGENVTYQWQYMQAKTHQWYNFSKSTASEFTRKISTTWDGWKIRCVVSDGNKTEYSHESLITIVESIEIETQPSSIEVLKGQIAEFRVSASLDNLNYQWQTKNGNTGLVNKCAVIKHPKSEIDRYQAA